MEKTKKLGQYFTPAWAAEILFNEYFQDVDQSSVVWEPTCGNGNMLAAIPFNIRCIGTEIDPVLAYQAMERTGRQVLIGDCRTVPVEHYGITHVFGNPPFIYSVFRALMDKCANLLNLGNKAGLLIPAYFLQTSRPVMDLCRKWSIDQKILPRDLFPGLTHPLVFATFIRDNFPRLFGFSLFHETAEIKDLPQNSQELFANSVNGSRNTWKTAVSKVLNELGGEADLKAIYKAIEGKRPTPNTYWKEKVRQVLQQSFTRVGNGIYSNKAA